MSVGWQEIVALVIVALVLSAAIYRRWHKGRARPDGRSGCDTGAKPPKEATLRFYRRRR